MTLISEIIRDAYRETNIIAINSSPTVNETAEALRLLNRFIPSLIGNEAGEELISFSIGKNNETSYSPFYRFLASDHRWVPAQARLVLNLEEAQEISLSPNPQDGQRFAILDASGNLATFPFTVNGNGRNIEGVPSQVFNTNGISREWFYRADLGNWVVINPVADTDPSPFPAEFDELFVCNLAMRLNTRNGRETAPETVQAYNRTRSLFKSRYDQIIQVPSELALTRNVGDRQWNNHLNAYDDTDSFNYGII